MTNYQPYPDPSSRRPARRLTRSSQNRMLGGVCGGLAEYTGLDPTLVRVVLVAVTILGFGSGVLLYLAAWLLMPEA